MSLELSEATKFSKIIFSKNFYNLSYWFAFLKRSFNKFKDPFFIYNSFQRFKKLENRNYLLLDPNNKKILSSPTFPQRQSAISVLYYRKNFFKGVSETLSNLGCKYILDVGANIGYYSRAYSFSGENLEIIAIEPDMKNIGYIANNLSDRGNVQVFHMGLSNKFGRFEMKLPEYSLNRKRERKYMTGLYTACGNESQFGTRFTSGDNFLDFIKVEPIDLGWIKVDVEGFEKNVLEGFAKTLLETNAVIEIEVNKFTMKLSQTKLQEINDFMNNNYFYPYIEKRLISRLQVRDLKIEVFDLFFIKKNVLKAISEKLDLIKCPLDLAQNFDFKYLNKKNV